MIREKLFIAALQAQKHAYSPFSGYRVGAAVLSANGEIFAGCNVENQVYPLGQCAERVAIQNMVSAGTSRFEALILVTENGSTPCGACRQVMAEFSAEETVVYIANLQGVLRETSVAELLPDSFSFE